MATKTAIIPSSVPHSTTTLSSPTPVSPSAIRRIWSSEAVERAGAVRCSAVMCSGVC
jgi:hypothetical protein